MKIALICKRHYTNRDLLTDPIGRLYHFPLNWKKLGQKVEVFLFDYYSLKPAKKNYYGIDFTSEPFFPFPTSAFKKHLIRLNSFNPDIIISSGDALMGHYGLKLSQLYQVPFVFDLYHDYADFKTSKIPFWKRWYYHALKSADLVVCDSNSLKQRISSFSSNLAVCTQGTDANLFQPRDTYLSRKLLGLCNEDYILGFTGSLDKRINLKQVLDAIDILNSDISLKKTFRFLIAGINTAKYPLTHSNIIFLGNKKQSEIPLVLSACDCLLIPMHNKGLATTCNPCKLSEYLACKKPIIATHFSNIRDYLTDDNSIVFSDTAEELAEKIKNQIASPKIYSFPKSLQWETISLEYLNLLESLI